MRKGLIALLVFHVAAFLCAGQQPFRSNIPTYTNGLVAWYSTDKAVVSGGAYQAFVNRRPGIVANAAPWDGNPAAYIPRALNGYPTAEFDAINDRYEAAITGTRSGVFHIFLVGYLTAWSGGYQQFFNLNEDDLRVQQDAVTSGKFNLVRRSGAGDVGFDHTANLPTEVPFVASWKFNGAASRSWITYRNTNGVLTSTVATGTCGTNLISSTVRFPWFNGIAFNLYEFRIYNQNLQGLTETNIVNELRTRYNF